MKKILNFIASMFSAVAIMEVSTASLILIYQPEPPKKN